MPDQKERPSEIVFTRCQPSASFASGMPNNA
jgi:hypothetical protein